MKNLIFSLLALGFIACSGDDVQITSEEVSLFVNHFKTTSPLSGTALVVQENAEIGSENYNTLGNIKDFEFTTASRRRIDERY